MPPSVVVTTYSLEQNVGISYKQGCSALEDYGIVGIHGDPTFAVLAKRRRLQVTDVQFGFGTILPSRGGYERYWELILEQVIHISEIILSILLGRSY